LLRNGSAPQVVGDAGGVEQVLHAEGNAVQRAAIFARGNLRVGGARRGQRPLRHQRDHRTQARIEAAMRAM
jgi:hypothetical protein